MMVHVLHHHGAELVLFLLYLVCVRCFLFFFFFFSSRRRHTRCSRDWSSDVCSSDLSRDIVVSWVDFVYHSASYPKMRKWNAYLRAAGSVAHPDDASRITSTLLSLRSEERRVGKECRYRWWPYHEKRKTGSEIVVEVA